MTQKHVLVVLTSNEAGWRLCELALPYEALVAAGHQVTICSIDGGVAPMADPSSDPFISDSAVTSFQSNAAKMDLTRNTLPIKYFSGKGFDSVLLVGGTGCMFDFHQSEALLRVICECYEKNGVIGAVGHATVGLVDVKLSDGAHLIANRDITGFSNAEEAVGNYVAKLLVHSLLRTELLENMIVGRGARYAKSDQSGKPFVRVDGHLVTGQNAISAKEFTLALMKVLQAPPTVTKRRPSLTQPVNVLNAPKIIKEGWMDKMGHSLLSGWTRRWFSLHRRPDGEVVLEYWVNETKLMAERKGCFIISRDTDIEVEPNESRKNCFRLKNEHGTYLLSAATVMEMDQWINTFRNRGHHMLQPTTQGLAVQSPSSLPKKVNMIFTACAMIQSWVDNDRSTYGSYVSDTFTMIAPTRKVDAHGMDAVWAVRMAMGADALNTHICEGFSYPSPHALKCLVRVMDKSSNNEVSRSECTFNFDGSDIKVIEYHEVKR